MTDMTFNGSCACSCGTVKLQVKKPPLVRFNCHCTICQSVYKKPFADAVVLRRKDVVVEDMAKINFKKHRPPPNLDRGICPSCEKPAVGFMKLGPGMDMCFLPSHMFENADDLPPTDLHIFYKFRSADVEDSLPKYQTYLTSNLGFTRYLMPRMFTR